MNTFRVFANILLAVNILLHCQKAVMLPKILLFLWLDAHFHAHFDEADMIHKQLHGILSQFQPIQYLV
jgi:hypothetical protein